MTINKDTIFMFDKENKIQEMSKTPYDSEKLLQELIEKHPELLVGHQLDPDDPPQWLMVKREAQIQDAPDASYRWSVDHLLLDQNGVPTFVEVKRSSDTRIRREVVGQMMEYAANALAHWPPDEIRRLAEATVGGVEALDERVATLVDTGSVNGPEDAVTAFWESVDENLRESRVRLLFVADELPRELKLIIEFLNDKMRDVQVAGIELVQYQEGDLRVLVPRVVGQTEASRNRKTKASSRKTTMGEFLDKCSPDVRKFFEEALHEATQRGLSVNWGIKGFSLRFLVKDGPNISILYGFPPGALGSEFAFIEGKLQGIDDPAICDDIRRVLVGEHGFQEKGQYALRLDLRKQTINAASAGVKKLVEVATKIMGEGE